MYIKPLVCKSLLTSIYYRIACSVSLWNSFCGLNKELEGCVSVCQTLLKQQPHILIIYEKGWANY